MIFMRSNHQVQKLKKKGSKKKTKRGHVMTVDKKEKRPCRRNYPIKLLRMTGVPSKKVTGDADDQNRGGSLSHEEVDDTKGRGRGRRLEQ